MFWWSSTQKMSNKDIYFSNNSFRKDFVMSKMSAVNIATLATLHLPEPMHLNSQGQIPCIVPQLHLLSHLPTSFHHFPSPHSGLCVQYWSWTLGTYTGDSLYNYVIYCYDFFLFFWVLLFRLSRSKHKGPRVFWPRGNQAKTQGGSEVTIQEQKV